MNERARHLLASDLDGTLIPTSDEAAHRRAVVDFREAMEEARPRLALAYVTGRYFEQALRGVAGWALPVPDFLVCDVGTTVYRRTGDDFAPDEDFAEVMRAALGAADASALRATLAEVEGVDVQEDAAQGRFKASFTFRWERRRHVGEGILARLEGSGLAVDLVTSRDLITGLGLLDVLPAGGAKDRGVAHVARVLGLEDEHVVFAGDSGNDEAALLSGVRAILVGNADDELREHVRAEAERRGLEERVYLADRSMAAGVLEGLVHFGVLAAR